MSSIVVLDLHNRYSGYCAWRGVLEASDESAREVASSIKKAYPDIGRCLYFDVAHDTHAVLYELLKGRLNWLWYINQPEPQLKVLILTSPTVQQYEPSYEQISSYK